MKKLLAFLLTVVMVVTMTVAAHAADGTFMISPTLRPAPSLIGFKNMVEECVAEIIITAYANRHTLPESLRNLIEEAYDVLAKTDDLGSLNDKLADFAKDLNVSTSDFAISDLFDIRMTDCESHETHGAFDITLSPESLSNFVCLLHYKDGLWSVVENAKVTNNGTHLQFTTEDFSPFAIVVNTKTADEPGTSEDDSSEVPGKPGDNSNTAVYAVIMLGSALSVILLARKLRKQSV